MINKMQKTLAASILAAAFVPTHAATPEALALKEARKIDATCEYSSETGRTIKISKELSAHLYSLLSCGGGNHWESYLMLIRNGKKASVLQIGGKGIFDPAELKLNAGRNVIEVSGMIYLEDDRMCCPSQTAAKNFEIRGQVLSELIDES